MRRDEDDDYDPDESEQEDTECAICKKGFGKCRC